jgi:hypothetical protein
MSARMSMIFSQNGGVSNKVVMRNAPVAAPVVAPVAATARSSNPPPKPRSIPVGLMATNRSAPKGIRQLFNLGDIMANPGTPCKACGA